MPRPLFSSRFQPISPWAEANIYLDDNSPMPGRLKLFPWQRDILNAYHDPNVRQITLMMSSQIGKSVVMLCILGYHIGTAPKNIFLVQPTQKILNRFRKEKFIPMVNASPTLNNSIQRTQVGTIPVDEMPFAGGTVFIGYSGSPASLKSLSVSLVLADEVDSYQGNADTANPLSIIWQRLNKFGKRGKMVVTSTPVESGTSLVEQEFNEGSQEYYMVPCPHCELAHCLEWDNVSEGKLYCPGCGAHITEEQRMDMITSKGFWKSEKENATHKSYHINQFYSTTNTIADTAAEYRENNARGFFSQVLGQPYRSLVNDGVSAESIESLYSDAWDIGDGKMGLGDATAVTASVDIQLNRLELQVCLWKDMVPRVTQQIRIPVINEFYDLAFQRLHTEFTKWNPDRIFIDRHYPTPDDVDHYARQNLWYWIVSGKLWLIVGTENSFNSPLIRRYPTAKNPYNASLAVDTGKEWVHTLIRTKSISINPYGVPDDFSQQLSSEELRWTTTSTGREKRAWVKTRRLNEALDCLVYNACARESLGLDYARQKTLSWDSAIRLVG